MFANIEAVAKTDLSKALLIRQNNFAEKEYREADRQWVRVTGVMSSEPRRGWDSGTGLLLKRVQLLRDGPPPRIKDATVLGVFQNATAEPLDIELRSRTESRRDLLSRAARGGQNDNLGRPTYRITATATG